MRIFLTIYSVLAFTIVTFSQKPVITSVTVLENGNVEINWQTDSSVSGYEVFRTAINNHQEPGFHLLHTVSDIAVSQYVDTEVDARLLPVGYRIQYLNTSLISDAHYTMYIEPVTYDSCTNTNTITWTSYSGWDSGFSYRVYANNVDVSSSDLETDIDTVFVHTIQQGVEYSYKVEAINASSAAVSSSNLQTVYTTEIIKPSSLVISNIAYNGSDVQITALVDNSAHLLGHVLMAGADNTNFSEVGFVDFDENESEINFLHSSGNQPLIYKASAVVYCSDTVLNTDLVKPLVLKATYSDESEVRLAWNASFIESTEIYTVNINVDGVVRAAESTLSNTMTINYSTYGETAEAFCFFVAASESNGYTSMSNTVCVTRQAKVKAPTAFSPNGDGMNDYFGPFLDRQDSDNSYIQNAVVDAFKIIIYDKYGGAVYVSDDPYYNWDGTVNNRPVSEGGYIYFLEFTTVQGKTYKKSGTINVVYP